MSVISYGQITYYGYRIVKITLEGHKTFPEWEQLTDNEKIAFMSAAMCAIGQYVLQNNITFEVEDGEKSRPDSL